MVCPCCRPDLVAAGVTLCCCKPHADELSVAAAVAERESALGHCYRATELRDAARQNRRPQTIAEMDAGGGI